MIWASDEKNVQSFIETHLKNGTFTDNNGIINYATSFLLNSNFMGHPTMRPIPPFTQLSCGNNNAPTLWVGYYQDTTLRAGHDISQIN